MTTMKKFLPSLTKCFKDTKTHYYTQPKDLNVIILILYELIVDPLLQCSKTEWNIHNHWSEGSQLFCNSLLIRYVNQFVAEYEH